MNWSEIHDELERDSCRIRASFAPDKFQDFRESRMPLTKKQGGLVLAAVSATIMLAVQPAKATVVEFQTVMGNFEVNLYDNATPATVANFLDYVNNAAYTNAIFHRSVPGFVVQAGGFAYDPAQTIIEIPANPSVTNEPEFANVRGTIAMAKIGSDPNSATNQWFINLADNSSNLDGQNGGFTAFGEVVGNGMDVVDAIAALPTFLFAAPFNEIPLTNYTNNDFDTNVPLDDTHLIIINAVIVSDTTVDSAGAAGLMPMPNTATNPPAPPPAPPPAGGGGGGSLGFLGLLALGGLARRRIFVRR